MNNKKFYFNWKMNIVENFTEIAEKYTKLISKYEKNVIVFPSDLYINKFKENGINKDNLGVQNISWKSNNYGAFTGQLSVKMISDLFGSLIGHSEVREHFKLSVDELYFQIKTLLEANLNAVFCIGHGSVDFSQTELEEKALGEVENLLKYLKKENISTKKLTIAYEPIWAIGTGKSASQEQIEEFFAVLNDLILTNNDNEKISLLYGGSVNSSNLNEFILSEQIDGFLIGGASLKLSELDAILNL